MSHTDLIFDDEPAVKSGKDFEAELQAWRVAKKITPAPIAAPYDIHANYRGIAEVYREGNVTTIWNK